MGVSCGGGVSGPCPASWASSQAACCLEIERSTLMEFCLAQDGFESEPVEAGSGLGGPSTPVPKALAVAPSDPADLGARSSLDGHLVWGSAAVRGVASDSDPVDNGSARRVSESGPSEIALRGRSIPVLVQELAELRSQRQPPGVVDDAPSPSAVAEQRDRLRRQAAIRRELRHRRAQWRATTSSRSWAVSPNEV